MQVECGPQLQEFLISAPYKSQCSDEGTGCFTLASTGKGVQILYRIWDFKMKTKILLTNFMKQSPS
jgi:hypothetical protein